VKVRPKKKRMDRDFKKHRALRTWGQSGEGNQKGRERPEGRKKEGAVFFQEAGGERKTRAKGDGVVARKAFCEEKSLR